MRPKLKHCPFCGLGPDDNTTFHSFAVPAVSMHSYDHNSFRVECEECTVYGPLKPTGDEAITAWNTRAKK